VSNYRNICSHQYQRTTETWLIKTRLFLLNTTTQFLCMGKNEDSENNNTNYIQNTSQYKKMNKSTKYFLWFLSSYFSRNHEINEDLHSFRVLVLNITSEIIFGTPWAQWTYHKPWTELASLYSYHIVWAVTTKGQVVQGWL